MPHTHQLAVIAYIIFDNKFLLLKRNNEPKVWGPPGGRLEPDEDPNTGVLREAKEETGLDIKVMLPSDIWFGTYRENILVSIDYLAEADSNEVVLSDEHAEYCWASIEDLRIRKPPLGESKNSFLLKDFEKAWALYCKLK